MFLESSALIASGNSQLSTIEKSVLEQTSALETVSNGLIYQESANESGNAQDTNSVNIIFSLSVSEAGNAADSSSFIINFVQTVSESGSATSTSTLDLTLTVNESGNAQETVTNSMTAALTTNEAGNAQDISNTSAIFPETIAESGNAQDSFTEFMYAALDMSESGNFIDISYTNLSANISFTEYGNAVDTINYIDLIETSVYDTETSIDTNSSNYLFDYIDNLNATDTYTNYTTNYSNKLPLINPYFNQNQSKSNQNIIQGLSTEVIKMMGRVYYYLPRNQQLTQLILGEDVLSSFDVAIPIEMYLVDSMGFDGQKEIYSKFGLQINNSYKLAVSIPRWEQEVMSMFNGQPYLNGTATFNKTNYNRPFEGDLIYDPMTNFLMVIKFVDYDAQFFQLGKNYTYTLSCEAYLYQNEIVDTGVPEIDLFDTTFSQDMLSYTITDEFGNDMLQEDSDYFLQEITGEIAVSRDIEVDFQTPSTSINTVITTPFS